MNKNKGNIFLIIIIMICIICISGLSAFIFVNKSKLINSNVINYENKDIDINNAFYNFEEPFLVKLQDKSILKTTISISYNGKNKKLSKEIIDSLPKLRDKTLYILINKNKDSFKSENLDKIKEEFILEYNKILLNGKINDVYFSELIQQ